MKRMVKGTELRQMSPERQEEAIKELVRAANSPPNGEMRDLDQQICAFEEKFGLSSQELRRELAQGRREESWEVCQWLMLLDQRDYLLGARSARSH
ncbi:MAG TPA: hypothetical protein VIG99_00750 [Myxococcaceae bacterium]|jgi:hypothetical protein